MLKRAYSGRGFRPFPGAAGPFGAERAGGFPRYDGVPIRTHYCGDFGKYAKVSLVRGGNFSNFWSFSSAGEIFPHLRRCAPSRRKAGRGTSPDMMAYLLVRSVSRNSGNMLKLAWRGRGFIPSPRAEFPGSVKRAGNPKPQPRHKS